MQLVSPTKVGVRLHRVGCVLLMVAAFVVLPACSCGGTGGGTIPCLDDTECPNELVCDTTGGVCVDPGDLNPYDCTPPLPGCACNDGDSETSCLIDDDSSDLVGSCRVGRSLCENGVYSACELVADPYCNGVGVSSGDFDLTDDNSENVELGPEGEIVLDPDVKSVEFGFLWVANTGENTVSKIDVDTGKEVARYASVTNSGGLGLPAVPSPGAYDGDENSCGNCPSRTAIDFKGDAFVANRAFGLQGTVTKFANASEDCNDNNGNGVIDTSVDVDGDGQIDITDTGEFLGEDDECILWTAQVGGNDGVPRALAIDAGGPDGEAGNVWVGLFNEQRVIQISGDTGNPITLAGSPVSVSIASGGNNSSPYGAAVDGGGNLWVTGLHDGDTVYLARVNTYQATLEQLYTVPDDDDGCSYGYGISIDSDQRIWLGGWQCQDLKVFEPVTEMWYRRDFDDISRTRGVAVDQNGQVWVAFTDGQVGKLKVDDIINMGQAAPVDVIDVPGIVGLVPDADIGATIGVGIDRNGACWAVSRNDDNDRGTATRIDTAGNVESFPVGKRPYTYSDFTGFGLTTVVRPNGYWRGKLGGCATTDAVTDWRTLEWFEREPPGTAVRMRIRVADTVAGLATATWYGPWDDSPVDLDAEGLPDAKFAEVEVQLSTSDPAITPAFLGFSLGFVCPGVPPIP